MGTEIAPPSAILTTLALVFRALVLAASVVSSCLQSLSVNTIRVKSAAQHVELWQDQTTIVRVKKVVEREPAR